MDTDGDVLSTRLAVDLSTRRSTAVVRIIPRADGFASLDVHGLEVHALGVGGAQVEPVVRGGQLELTTPAGTGEIEVVVEYTFSLRGDLRGATSGGLTLTWPQHCGNLFPCQSSPSDGARFDIELAGVSEGQVAIYPRSIPVDAPAFMVAWAVGDYRYRDLGTTAAGTRVGVYYHPGEERAAGEGVANLRASFDWLERTYGPYPFGREVASVSASWGPSGYGGMEHHPFWHVSSQDLAVESIHVHEAVHGWFGNGVRLRCWEDFVLAEGTTSYVTARVLTVVAGPDVGQRLWGTYRERLHRAQATRSFRIAWPEGCDEADVERDLFTGITYMKGAFFLRAVAERVGAEALDRALARLYRERRGQAAGVADLLVAIEDETGYDPDQCAAAWLRSEALPPPGPCP